MKKMATDKHGLTRIIACALVAGAGFGQMPVVQQATMVFPVMGAPLAVEVVQEHATKLPDGTSKTETHISQVYRDASGRMRIEMQFPGPSGEPTTMIQIWNQPDGFMAALVPAEKYGGRLEIPKNGNAGFGFSQVGPLIKATGKKSEKNESLGTKTIDGIEYEGRRVTTTVDGQPALVAVDESWQSGELGLIGLIHSSGPDQEVTVKIRNLDRHDPDPTLFEIPADYSVVELRDGVRDGAKN
jgi:hypothetical protein